MLNFREYPQRASSAVGTEAQTPIKPHFYTQGATHLKRGVRRANARLKRGVINAIPWALQVCGI